MRYLFYSFACFYFLPICISHLDALAIENSCHTQFPGVTDERCDRVRGMTYEANDAANRGDLQKLRGLYFSIKKEVESMMRAQIRTEDFIDDVFEQNERRGYFFSDNSINYCKRKLGVQTLGIGYYCSTINIRYDFEEGIFNSTRYEEYEDQPHYDAPARLEAGLTLAIIGCVLTVIPNAQCYSAGKWAIGLGLTLMTEACIQGCERQDELRQNQPKRNLEWH